MFFVGGKEIKATILERFRQNWIVYFQRDKSVAGIADEDLVRLTDD